MKPLLLTIALLFSTPAWAEWELFYQDKNIELYFDLNTIRLKDGYVYYWELINWKKPIQGRHSGKVYFQSDCDSLRHKKLQIISYLKPMGVGNLIDNYSFAPDEAKWEYMPPDNARVIGLNSICSAIENIMKNNPPSRN